MISKGVGQVADQRKPRRRQPNARQVSDAQLAERDELIWQLRLQGLSLRQIGAKVGLSHPSVHDILQTGYQERIYPKVDEQRALELERLDTWLCKLQPGIDQGDDKAIATALRISERRARLVGMDAPTRVHAEVTEVTQQDLELQEMLREAQAREAVKESQLRAGIHPSGRTGRNHLEDKIT